MNNGIPERRLTMVLACMVLLMSCAVPMAPSGGTVDRTPPSIERSDPEDGTVNFDGTHVRMVFSGLIDQAAFQRAFTITPSFQEPVRFRFRGRRAEIHFPEPLRENTTYVITLDTQFRDLANTALTRPITFAFSTGPAIDEGRITGEVLHSHDLSGQSEVDVLIYRTTEDELPDPFRQRPHYRTQTGSDGTFELSYLPDEPFFIFALKDLNRNRTPDPGEPFAVPVQPLVLPQAPDTMSSPVRMYMSALDTVPPVAQRVRPFSEHRIAIRYSEPVRLQSLNPDEWALSDSAAGTPVSIEAVYQRADDPYQVHLKTAQQSPTTHRLEAPAVSDTSGNQSVSSVLSYGASAAADTAIIRFLRFLPSSPRFAEEDGTIVLEPGTHPGVELSEFMAVSALRGTMEIITENNEYIAEYELESADGTRFTLIPTGDTLTDGRAFRLTFEGATADQDTTFGQDYRYLPRDETGSLTGVVASDHPARVIVALYSALNHNHTPERAGLVNEDGEFLFDELSAGNYRVRAFADYDSSGTWDGGQIFPYRTPEPFVWSADSLRIRARWETVADTLVIPEIAEE